MLVLSRKKNETIIIDDHIVITVVEIRGDKVRLGIEAPKEIPIHRSEVHAAIQAEQPATVTEHKTGEQDPPKVTSAGS
jgi:carbon storage regulator